MTILDRYLARELIVPFLAGIAGFVAMMIPTILFGMLDLIASRDLPLGLVLKAVALRLPGLMVWAPPIAMLFGVSLAVGRLTRDSEVTAMRMAGIPLRRLIVPLLAAGAVASLASLLLNEVVSPWTNRRFMRAWREIVTSQRVPDVQQDVFFSSEGHYFYVRKVEKSGANEFLLRDVMIYEPRQKGFPVFTTAKTAESTGTVWVLRDGYQLYFDAHGRSQAEVPFREMTLNLQRPPEDVYLSQRLPDEMSALELRRQIDLYRQSGISVGSLEVEYQFKFAIPLACVVLTLVGMPLAVHFSRFGGFAGLLIGITISFFYWNAYFLGEKLGAGGRVSPVLAAWGPNAAFSLLGVLMLWREE
ncbi:MAG: LptF/LptG family permease [Armatimonadota bacterium]